MPSRKRACSYGRALQGQRSTRGYARRTVGSVQGEWSLPSRSVVRYGLRGVLWGAASLITLSTLALKGVSEGG
jgi:hypothetical protein